MRRALRGRGWDVSLVAIAAISAIALVWVIPGAQNDFIYDWLSARSFVLGLDPYRSIGTLAAEQGLVSSQALAEIHPRLPAALILQSPIGFVPYQWSYITGRLLTVASAFSLAWVIAQITRIRIPVAMAAVPAMLLVWPFSTVLEFSQSGFLIAALIGATWLLGERTIAGLPLGAAVCLKAWPWLIVPGLWLAGRRRSACGAAGVVVGLNLAGLTAPGVTPSGVLRMLDDAATFASSSLASLLGMSTGVAAAVGLAAIVIASIASENVYPWSILLALLAAPFVWIHYLPVLLVPLAIVIAASTSRSPRTRNGQLRMPLQLSLVPDALPIDQIGRPPISDDGQSYGPEREPEQSSQRPRRLRHR